MIFWFSRKKRDAREKEEEQKYKIALTEAFNQLHESVEDQFNFFRQDLYELSEEARNNSENISEIFKNLAEKSKLIHTIENQFKFFIKKTKGSVCQKSCTKK